jgi:hypothetical protein
LPRKFGRDNFLCWHATRVQLLDSPQLVWLQARSVSQYFLNDCFLPVLRTRVTAA